MRCLAAHQVTDGRGMNRRRRMAENLLDLQPSSDQQVRDRRRSRGAAADHRPRQCRSQRRHLSLPREPFRLPSRLRESFWRRVLREFQVKVQVPQKSIIVAVVAQQQCFRGPLLPSLPMQTYRGAAGRKQTR